MFLVSAVVVVVVVDDDDDDDVDDLLLFLLMMMMLLVLRHPQNSSRLVVVNFRTHDALETPHLIFVLKGKISLSAFVSLCALTLVLVLSSRISIL